MRSLLIRIIYYYLLKDEIEIKYYFILHYLPSDRDKKCIANA